MKYWALAIVILTMVTRVIWINHSPPQLGNDEISIAWDAYSLIHTGRDEHNHILPLAFQSHGTYKAPLTAYLATVPTAIFGNTNYSARLPSIILGSLTVILLGLTVYELFVDTNLALVSSLVLAISPAHITASRNVLETNVALFFVVLGVFAFFRRRPFISAIAFAASIYAYHTEWGLTPLLLLALLVLYFRQIVRQPIYYVSAALFVILVIPIFYVGIVAAGPDARQNTEFITHSPVLEEKLRDPHLFFWQKGQILVKSAIGGYSSYIEPAYIFFNGIKPLSAQDPYTFGLFLEPLLVAFVVGLFTTRQKFVYAWALLAPIIPAITIGDHIVARDLVAVAPYAIIIASGLLTLWHRLPRLRLLWVGALAVTFFYFGVIYFYHLPYESGESYQTGYQQMALYIKAHYGEYHQFVIDPHFGDYSVYDGVPHLYIPYFTAMDPHKMLTRVGNDRGLFFDKYVFRSINWGQEQISSNVLYAVPAANLAPENLKLQTVDQIKLPNGKLEFVLLALQPVAK